VQVLQLGDQLGFGFETADEIRAVGVLGQDDLNGYLAIDGGLLRPVDGTIGPLADQLQQLVSFDGLGSGNGQMSLRFGT
jgi:hypothetical protein